MAAEIGDYSDRQSHRFECQQNPAIGGDATVGLILNLSSLS